MFVRDSMTSSPIVIYTNTPILEALNIMKKQKIRQLPVVDKGSLVGLVTERELLTVTPSPATTLSIYEMNYLLAKMVVSEVMVKNPISVEPGCTIEEAALIMRDNKIGCLLVVENDELKGIITQTDIFEAMIKLFGLRRAGTRLVVEATDRIGALAEILGVIREHGVNVIGVACLEKGEQRVNIMIRLSTADPGALIQDLEKLGFTIQSVS